MSSTTVIRSPTANSIRILIATNACAGQDMMEMACKYTQHTDCRIASNSDSSNVHRDCIEIEANCAHEDICDVHADCVFNATIRRSSCVCQEGYDGTGRSCHLIAECKSSADCGYHSVCSQGVCDCDKGYERDNSDL